MRFKSSTPEDASVILPDSQLTGGTLGLVATFIRAVQFASEFDDEWVLFLEDDVVFRRSFSVDRLLNELNRMPLSIGLSRFGFIDGTEWIRRLSILQNLRRRLSPRMRFERHFRRDRYRRRFRIGTHAMAIRVRRIPELLDYMADIDLPLDHVVFWLEVDHPSFACSTSRNFATQGEFGSDIKEGFQPPRIP